MTTTIKINEDQFCELNSGCEIALVRDGASEYAVTFPKQNEPIKVRFHDDDYEAILTERVDSRIDDQNISITYKVKLL